MTMDAWMRLAPAAFQRSARAALCVCVAWVLVLVLVLQLMSVPWAVVQGPRHAHPAEVPSTAMPSGWAAWKSGVMVRHAAPRDAALRDAALPDAALPDAALPDAARPHAAPAAKVARVPVVHHHRDEQRHHHAAGDPAAVPGVADWDGAQAAVLAFLGHLGLMQSTSGWEAGLARGLRHVLHSGPPSSWTDGPQGVPRRPPRVSAPR